MVETVTLTRLAAAFPGASVHGEAEVASVTHDSRDARSGALFVAIRGMSADGHDFAESAVAAGAAALAVDHRLAIDIPQLVLENTRAALAPLAAVVYHDPSREIDVVGVTGTNGKTTVTHILESIANAAGIPSGVIGTVGARIGSQSIPVSRTTPEASDLQAILRRMADSGVRLAALEVSSHAMELHRVDSVAFRAVAFTNLSQDHLDFHGDMDQYFQAKAELFSPGRGQVAVINIDDEAGRRIAARTSLPTVTVSTKESSADVVARVAAAGLFATEFDIRTERWERRLQIPLAGAFNVLNASMAIALAETLGIDADSIAAGVESLEPVPGRFELIDEGQRFGVVVDYAHTPEAIANIVMAAEALTTGRVIVVAGAAGDRDSSKRPLMGRAAAQADLAIVTSDNPRSENPVELVETVAAAAEGAGGTVLRIVDRRAAIHAAIDDANPGDIVLILGKGHESGQETSGVVVPFDDREVARERLVQRSADRGGAS